MPIDAKIPYDPIVATCKKCGAGYSEVSLTLLDKCTRCGQPFIERETDKRPDLKLLTLRRRIDQAVEDKSWREALAILEELPPVFAAIGELARAVVALNGECNCGEVRIIGKTPHKAEPCPHRRAQRALSRCGIDDEHVAELRSSIGLVVK